MQPRSLHGRVAILLALTLGAVAVTLVISGGCSRDTPTAPASQSQTMESGVRGRVLSAGGPASASSYPYPATEITVLDGEGEVVTRVTPDADGRFTVPLPPGSYTLKARPTMGNPWFLDEPPVDVLAGRFTKVTLYAQMR